MKKDLDQEFRELVATMASGIDPDAKKIALKIENGEQLTLDEQARLMYHAREFYTGACGCTPGPLSEL